MSEQYQIQNQQPLNPNFVAFVLVISFGIICGIIVASQQLAASSDNAEDRVEVALVVATETPQPQPSHTPLPPTPTGLPSSSPAPTATLAAAVPTAVDTPQPALDAEVSSDGGSSTGHDPALVSQGQQLFTLCSACHGPDARGLPNLGKDLVASEFVAGLTDEALLEFIKIGRPLWDPLNTTGLDMPGRGGNPALKDEEILAIIAYVRSLSAVAGQ